MSRERPFTTEELAGAGEPLFSQRRIVRFQDVDAAGTIFFARALEYMSEAYVALLLERGVDLPGILGAATWVAPYVHAEADFLLPLRFPDAIDVELVKARVAGHSYALGFRIRHEGKAAIVGQSVHVVVDAKTFKKAPVPPLLRAALGAPPADLGLADKGGSLEIRPATEADYPSFVRLYPELGTPDPTPDAGRFAREVAPHTLLALRGDVAVGYLFFQVLTETAYVRHLVVAPEARRGGVARALMRAAALRVAAAGRPRWELNVKPDNVAAIALYEALGLRLEYRSTALSFDWPLVDALPPSPEGVTTGPLADVDLTSAEQAFRLPAGQLAVARQTGGRVLLEARDGAGAWLGVAVFDPAFPGAFPLRARDVAAAAALLRGLRPHATQPRMQVVCEDAPELTRALVDAGAEVKMEMAHYAGPLPTP